jgi:hypothetical protein
VLADSSIEHLFELSRLRHTTSVHYWPCVSYGRREAFTNRSHSRLLPRTLSPPSAPASQVRSHPCCPARAATSQPAPPTPWRYRLACSALRSHSLQSAQPSRCVARAQHRRAKNQVSTYFRLPRPTPPTPPASVASRDTCTPPSAAFRSATLNTRERAQRWRRRIGLRPARVVWREEAHHRGDSGAAVPAAKARQRAHGRVAGEDGVHT